jgi:hypothetical protein
MNKPVRQVFHVKLFAGCSYVSILIPVTFKVSIDRCNQDVRPDVKLSLLIQKRNYIFLDDVSSLLSLFSLSIFFKDSINLLECLHDHNSISSIRIFSRFHKPGISSLRLESILNLIVWIGLFTFFFFSNLFVSLVVLLQKNVELLVMLLFDMESHGNIQEGIFLFAFIVSFQVHKQSLFVWKVPIVAKMIVRDDIIGFIL